MTYSDKDAAAALVAVLGKSKWEVVAYARGFMALLEGGSAASAAKIAYDSGASTLKRSLELLGAAKKVGFISQLKARERIGSAENPITKLFPATITEERFLEVIEELRGRRKGIEFTDDRESGHGLTDFTLLEGDVSLPVNIKNAGTRFLRAQSLVGLEPDDCIPIPAYKANAAVESLPSLVYVVSADYDLIGELTETLPKLLSPQESIAWDLLNKLSGAHLRNAEDAFIFSTVRKYWKALQPIAAATPFHVISARKTLRILATKPKRTPGIGQRGWGTGATAEVNVHVSVKDDMTPWTTVAERIAAKGLADVIGAVNRKRTEEVYDPEI